MAIIKGTTAKDTKVGTAANDQIYGYQGDDVLSGRNGNDQIWGAQGNDKLYGENNDDLLWGGDGNDILYGGAGADQLFGDAGTDTLKGETGNDVLKGGLGVSYLYGGDGNDSLYYDPTLSNIKAVGGYLSGSILNGDGGTDTLNIYNRSTYGTANKASQTEIYIEEGVAHIKFSDHSQEYGAEKISVGTAKGIEKFVVTGSGGLDFTGDLYGNTGISITGTAGNDTFQSYYGSDEMKGGAGNDIFFAGGGKDKIISEANDADLFEFNGWGGETTITGFNGAGAWGGDRINIEDYYLSDPKSQIKEANGWTTFSLDSGDIIKVQAVGLDEGVDYFLI